MSESPRTRKSLIAMARSVRANKKLGQNFFVDPERLTRIVEALSPVPDDHIIEIGPGLGFLTELLAQTGARTTAIELDRSLVEHLNNRLFNDRVEIINADFLEFDLTTVTTGEFKVVGNIPYQITSPIIGRLFGEIGKPSPWLQRLTSLVMTIQAEVADRLVASPGSKTYSQLSVLRDYYFEAEVLFTVPPDCFYPQPEILSKVVRLIPHPAPPVQCSDHQMLRRVVVAGFKQRRKMLKNNLGFLKRSDRDIMETLRSLSINPLARAEDLSLEQFARITDAFAST